MSHKPTFPVIAGIITTILSVILLSSVSSYFNLEHNGIVFSDKNSTDITRQYNPIFNVSKAYTYLVNRYDTHYGLIKENENIDKYWLWSDNMLAAQAIKEYNYSLYANITNTIRNYTQHYHIDFHSAWRALIDPTSIDQPPSFRSPINKNVETMLILLSLNLSTFMKLIKLSKAKPATTQALICLMGLVSRTNHLFQMAPGIPLTK